MPDIEQQLAQLRQRRDSLAASQIRARAQHDEAAAAAAAAQQAIADEFGVTPEGAVHLLEQYEATIASEVAAVEAALADSGEGV